VDVEKWICRAEIAYKSGNIKSAIRYAQNALRVITRNASDASKAFAESEIAIPRLTALQIFIARAYSKLGKFRESNAIYRKLINEKNYLPPVIMGLLYNNFQNPQKTNRNLGLIKMFVR